MTRRISLTLALTALAIAAAATPAQAAPPTVTCSAAGLAQVLVNDHPAQVVISTAAAAPTVVTVDGANTVCGGATPVNLVRILITDTTAIGDPTTSVRYVGNLPNVDVDANLLAGNDAFVGAGTQPVDTINGGNDNDTLTAGPAGAKLFGQDGTDTLTGDAASDVLDGGPGIDGLDGKAGDDQLSGGTEGDNLVGGPGDDAISGGDDDDTLIGGPDNDTLDGGQGDDLLKPGTGLGGNDGGDLGAGDDTVSYDDIGAVNVEASLAAGAATSPAVGFTLSQTIVNVDNLVGGDGSDTLTGNDGVNRLAGGIGPDTLRGVGGIDTLLGGAAADDLDGGAGADILRGGTGSDILVGGAGNDLLYGLEDPVAGADGTIDTVSYRDRAGPALEPVAATLSATPSGGFGGGVTTGDSDLFFNVEALEGGAGGDALTGSTAVDTIDGAAGDDQIFGGPGKDVLDGGDGIGDTLSYLNDNTQVIADLRAPPAQRADTSDSTQNFENVIGGNAGAAAGGPGDTLIGNALTNTLDGRGGDDTITGGGAGDFLLGGDGIDTISGEDGDDAINGQNGDDILSGGPGADTINGEDGADTIQPGTGGGASNGGTGPGVNLLSYADLTAPPITTGVVVSLVAGGATVDGTAQSVSNFRDVTGTPLDDTLTGDSQNNVLTGLAGDDTFRAGPGANTIIGGTNNPGSPATDGDTAEYGDLPLGGIVAGLAAVAPQVTGFGRADTLTGIENLVGSPGADQLVGTSSPNRLDGAGGSDTIFGQEDLGDVLIGGAGDTDTLDYLQPATTADIVVNQSTDPSLTSGLTLTDDATGFENVRTGGGDDTVVGNDGPNVLDTGGGADTLIGLGDDDVLNGGDGDDTLRPGLGGGSNVGGNQVDTLSYAGIAAGVVASLAPGGTAVLDGKTQNLNTIENLTGGSGGDVLTGSSVRNVISGGPANDAIFGGGGLDDLFGNEDDDTLDGGAGLNDNLDGGPNGAAGDTVTYDGRNDGPVTASLVTGRGGVAPESDVYTDVENLHGGEQGDTLTGNGAVNLVDGDAGNDTIVGGDARDTLIGGDGTADTLSYAGETSKVVADLGAAIPGPGTQTDDTATFENVTGGGDDDTLTGSDVANRIVGDDGNDLIAGKAGDDTITGDDDDDVIDGGAGKDTIDGGDGDDRLNSSDGDGPDVLAGGGDNDVVNYAAKTGHLDVSLDGLANDGERPPAPGVGEGDNVLSMETVIGGTADDTLSGDQAINTLQGGDGNDTLIGGGSDDTLAGGIGLDIASYADRGAGEAIDATLNATPPAIAHGGAPSEFDTFASIEGLRGGAGADTLAGSEGNDTLDGGPGGDSLLGAGGADTMTGADGDDALGGGAGDDTLIGGNGNDRLDGGLGGDSFFGDDGLDQIFAFDGVVENIRCGAGDPDSATHDLGDIFPLGDCELRRVPSESELPFVPVAVSGPRDRDGDGVPDTADCNDGDPAVRPGAPEVPANGIDENCDGADAAPPRVATTLRTKFQRVKRGLRIRILELRQLPAGAVIEVSCRSSRTPKCPFTRPKKRTVGAARATLSIRGYFGDRPLSVGTVIEVRVTLTGAVGRTTVLTMSRRGSPPKVEGCLPPGATKAVAC